MQRDEALSEFQNRLESQCELLREIVRTPEMDEAALRDTYTRIVRTAVELLGIERVSIWLYNPQRTRLGCEMLHDSRTGEFANGLVLEAVDFPEYFEALDEDRLIVAEDARTHPATAGFAASYLTVHDIYSMLDSPIRVRGETLGVVCHEKTGAPREWRLADRKFAGAIGDIVSVAMESHLQWHDQHRIADQAALLDQTGDAILVETMDDLITYWNRGAEKLYGWTRLEVIGQHAIHLKYFGESSLERIKAATALLRYGQWTGELTQIDKLGRELIVLSNWSLLRDEAGRPRGKLIINTDITEKRKLEQQILRAQRIESIGVLAGGIAHDLNNVLCPIMTSLYLLRNQLKSPEQVELIDLLDASVVRSSQMIRQILMFARGGDGTRSVVSLASIVRESETMLRPTFPVNIDISTATPADLWMVEGDATQLFQVITNLCINAREAMPLGGRLYLTLCNERLGESASAISPEAKPGSWVSLSVRDTGVGIRSDHLEKIFDPFFTTRDIGKGTGLGLSMVMGIVRRHGGFMTVSSQPGAGTEFVAWLPATDRPMIVPAPAVELALARGRSQWILVVDDDAAIRAVTREVLTGHGYRVLTASDGAEAIAVFAEHKARIRLIVLDLFLPILDGRAVLHSIRRMKSEVAVIASYSTSLGSRLSAEPGLTFSAGLPKPYTAEQLLRAVEKWLPASEPALLSESQAV